MKEQNLNLKTANKIVKRIVDDLTDRRGLRQEWEGIDDEIQKEIKSVWKKIIIEEMQKNG
jgi:hypothetical protein